MRYDVTVGNPPFCGNLHLKIIDHVIPRMENNGVGCFVHPARWLEDPLAELKKDSDKGRFKDIADRLEEVRILDNKTAAKKFGITVNAELMISLLGSRPVAKNIKIYDSAVQECIDIILAYSQTHNLMSHIDKDMVDGWRVQVKEQTATDPHLKSISEKDRKAQCNIFGMNQVNVFNDGFADGVEWMNTRRQTTGKRASGAPIPFSIKFKSKDEALNFERSCNTNFYNNIMYLLKWDMHTPFRFLPWMEDYSRPWTDEDYCKFFGELGMSEECQRWMCRQVYDYRQKDFVKYEHIG